MVIFVDFDNIKSSTSSKGLDFLSEKLIEVIGLKILSDENEIYLRVYGGWHTGQTRTKIADKLTIELQKYFPKYRQISNDKRIKIYVELVYKLEHSPKVCFYYSYREKNLPRNIRCVPKSEFVCSEDNCPMELIRHYIETKKCPNPNCSNKSIGNFLFRNEQKIVDSLLTCDLLNYSFLEEEKYLTLVSSDDDFLPSIVSSISHGQEVIHVLTQRENNNLYKEVNLKQFSNHYHVFYLE